MSIRPPSILSHEQWSWRLDLSGSAVTEAAVTALPWDRCFAEMKALEQGESVNHDERRQVGHYWLRAPEHAPTMGQAQEIGDTVERIEKLVAEIHGGALLLEDAFPVTHLLHIGIGGSALGAQFLHHALAQDSPIQAHFIDNLDPFSIERLLHQLRDHLASTLILVVSKSGGTTETMAAAELVFQHFRSCGHSPHRRAIALTHSESPLKARAQAEGWLAHFPIWEWLGGRFSITGPPGLLTAALTGVDIRGVLVGAREMDQWTRIPDAAKNPAAALAGQWWIHGIPDGRRCLVVLPYSDRLALFGRYLQQLLMESLGKESDRQGKRVHQGMTVLGNKGSTDQHALVQQLVDGRDDAFTLFIQVMQHQRNPSAEMMAAGDTLQQLFLGTRKALVDKSRPSVTWTIPQISATEIGATLALFERAVGLYASLLNINAYDQPGVETGKQYASLFAEKQTELLTLLSAQELPANTIATRLNIELPDALDLLQRLKVTGRVTDRRVGEEERTYRAT